MDTKRVITVGLVACSLLAMVMVTFNCIGRSEHDKEELNYLRNTLHDFQNPTQDNVTQRHFACLDSDYKAASYLRAGASVDDVDNYRSYCAAQPK